MESDNTSPQVVSPPIPQPPTSTASPTPTPLVTNSTPSGDKSLVLAAGVLGLIIIALFSSIFFVGDKGDVTVETDKLPEITAQTPTTSLPPIQRELGVITERDIPPAPYFNEFDETGLSPHLNAPETGKRFAAEFYDYKNIGEKISLEVTIRKAAKYYPIKQNEFLPGAVYFPSCFERECFDGKKFPIEVKPENVIIAIDLEFKNTTRDTLYLQGGNFARFQVGEDYFIPKGSKVTTNISTGMLQRFTDAPYDYVGPLDTQTFTFWVEVPHDQQHVTFMYGGGKTSQDIAFDQIDPSLVIPLTFGVLQSNNTTQVR